ncbi:MAG: hypothetical protein AAF596_02305, partial [Planctomycetota bacterium]
VRVPGFVSWPGTVASKTIDTPLHVVDWLPTIADVARAGLRAGSEPSKTDTQPAFDGQSFASQLIDADPDEQPTRTIYLTHHPKTNKWAVRRGDWKVVHYGKREPTADLWKLYNLASDPAESIDVASEYPDRVSELHRLFAAERAKDKAGPNVP